MRGKLHAMHGRDHGPRSDDPTNAEGFHQINLSDGGFVWYQFVVGIPGGNKQSVELIIKTSVGANGDVVTTLPPEYVTHLPAETTPLSGMDNTGAFRAFYIKKSTGQIIVGVAP